jgi:Fur family transcriptional regulator, stress-responsive regulator
VSHVEASPAVAARHDHHHHLVCRRCGRVAEVDCAERPAPCLEPAGLLGYAIDEAEVTFWGLCAGCQPGSP